MNCLLYHSECWGELSWSEWISLDAESDVYKKIPNKGGIYRIRALEVEPLIYIGQTGRNLRERLRALRKGVISVDMPFNDPHTAAPNLWVWNKEMGYRYECSVAQIELSTQNRQALEDMFLWRHRVEAKTSTLCNYGRFHPAWMKSLDRAKNVRGARLPEGEENPAGGHCSSHLLLKGSETDPDWMGLEWSPVMPLDANSIKVVPSVGGVYRIINHEENTVIYIGESKNLASRLFTHSRSSWSISNPCFSFALPEGMDVAHRRHEIEADLIGAYYYQHGYAPIHQYL